MVASYVKSLLNTIEYLNANGISWVFLSEYSSFVTNAREATATGSKNLNVHDRTIGGGAFTYNKALWIDSDIAWELKDFKLVYESDLDIVSGCYLINDDICSAIDSDKRPISKYTIAKHTEPFTVGSAGFGFMCVKYGVFEKMSRPWFPASTEKLKDPITRRTYEIPLGEDVAWCSSAKSSGYKIYLDPRVKLRHYKTTPLMF